LGSAEIPRNAVHKIIRRHRAMPGKIHIIQNIDIEGPGIIADWLSDNARDFTVHHAYTRDILPVDATGMQALIVLGGPMNVYEEERYPFLKREKDLLRSALDNTIPVLGICLGAQLLACAGGAGVKRSPQKEVGWSTVDLTDDGCGDPLFEGLSPSLEVFQWHEDMFELPQGAVLLGRSAGCPHQAMRLGANAYGLQFHLEVTADMVAAWVQAYPLHSSADCDPAAIMRTAFDARARHESAARRFCANFIRIL
jgi:GMP synthase (glutamine-hydrolysing)